MSMTSELRQLNVTLKGQDQDLPDRGFSTGFLGSSHGVDFSADATNSQGGMNQTESDAPFACCNYDDPNVYAQSAGAGDGFNGSLGAMDMTDSDPTSARTNYDDPNTYGGK